MLVSKTLDASDSPLELTVVASISPPSAPGVAPGVVSPSTPVVPPHAATTTKGAAAAIIATRSRRRGVRDATLGGSGVSVRLPIARRSIHPRFAGLGYN